MAPARHGPSGPFGRGDTPLARMHAFGTQDAGATMIRKLSSGKYRLYSRKKNPKTGRRRNLGTFATREDALKHERAVQYFKRH
jgi:hypothetical protein